MCVTGLQGYYLEKGFRDDATDLRCPLQVTVYVMGSSLGVLWVFKLMMVEDVALAWDCHFPALKLLQGLVMFMETFVGELPFFFLSGCSLMSILCVTSWRH